MPTARQWAETICQSGPLQVRAVKEAMLRGYNMPLEESLKLEREISNRLRTSDDYMEGVRAFIEKRKPSWKGR
jgi:enoyl-CoA hydratase/carnithine racemase